MVWASEQWQGRACCESPVHLDSGVWVQGLWKEDTQPWAESIGKCPQPRALSAQPAWHRMWGRRLGVEVMGEAQQRERERHLRAGRMELGKTFILQDSVSSSERWR